MTWKICERAVEKYFNKLKLGYAIVHTGKKGDKGIDIEAYSLTDHCSGLTSANTIVPKWDLQKLAGTMVAH
jgi:hypothetical protein